MSTDPILSKIPLNRILPSRTNSRKRFDETSLKELADSIKEKGVIQPVVVRPLVTPDTADITYEIVAGERRYRASKLAGLDSIPAIIRLLTDLEVLQIQIIENLQRSELHPYEEAQAFKALLENKDAGHWNADELAEKISKSRSYIYASLKLNDLCTYAVDQFLENKFGREIALLIARIPGAKLQEEAAKLVIAKELSYRATKEYIQATFTLDLSKAPWDKHSTTLYPAAGSCLSCPKRSGNYPELFADIESPDVCTDTACFAAKKVAYAKDLIQHHPKVIHGEKAKEIAPLGVYTYITKGFVSDVNNVSLDGHTASELLGDEVPEPSIVVDENSNTRKVWNADEVESLMAIKIKEKIASGELQPAPEKPKTPEQIEPEAKNLEAEKLTAHRQNLLNGLVKFWQSNKWTDEQYKKALQASVLAQINNASLDANNHIKNAFNSIQTDEEFVHSLTTLELMCVSLLLPSSEDIEAYPDILDEEPIDLNTMLDIVQIDPLELLNEPTETASTPNLAAHANELSAEGELAHDKSTAVETEPEPETRATPETASAGAVTLPPKLQEIKDKELARRARKAQKQTQKESASADV